MAFANQQQGQNDHRHRCADPNHGRPLEVGSVYAQLSLMTGSLVLPSGLLSLQLTSQIFDGLCMLIMLTRLVSARGQHEHADEQQDPDGNYELRSVVNTEQAAGSKGFGGMAYGQRLSRSGQTELPSSTHSLLSLNGLQLTNQCRSLLKRQIIQPAHVVLQFGGLIRIKP